MVGRYTQPFRLGYNILGFQPRETVAGSNQRAKASFALAMASASVSPALAQPGNSGKTADQRWLSLSNSTTMRSFIHAT